MVVIGIDLGTTNSAVAVFEDGVVEVIQDETGSRLIPSLVTFAEQEILVGASAKRESHRYPEDTIYDAKRFIGQKFHDKDVQSDVTNSLYKVVNQEGHPYVKVRYKSEDLTISIEEVTAHLLRHIKQVAENHLDQSVSRAVIAVPAHFDDTRRKATKKAAEIANFKMVRIINEPTAAAIASQYKKKNLHSKNVLVYDFGGGTFDVSIVSVHKHAVKVVTSDGDCYLGGKDIDTNLTEHILKIHDLDVKNSRKLRRFKNLCEETKKALSFSENHTTEISFIADVNDYLFSRQQFETINEGLFQKTIELVDRSLDTTKLTVNDIDEIVLAGGSSRIPRVQYLLKTKFPKSTINTAINPDEAIALGAALYGGQIEGDKVPLEIQDILTCTLGIGRWGGITDLILRRDTKLPCSVEFSSVTVKNFQEKITHTIYQGESLISNKNNLLGTITVTNIQKKKRGAVIILTTMSISEEGILKVTAKEAGTDNSEELTIAFTDGISSSPRAQEINCKTYEDELKYVEFIKKKNAFLEYCDDLKYNYQGKLEHQPDVVTTIKKIMKKCESLGQEEESVLGDLKHKVDLLLKDKLHIPEYQQELKSINEDLKRQLELVMVGLDQLGISTSRFQED